MILWKEEENMESKKKERSVYKKEVFEIEHLLKSRYFNRSAGIAKINHLIHVFPQSTSLLEKYNINCDLPILYTSNDNLKNLLIEFRIFIEEMDSEETFKKEENHENEKESIFTEG